VRESESREKSSRKQRYARGECEWRAEHAENNFCAGDCSDAALARRAVQRTARASRATMSSADAVGCLDVICVEEGRGVGWDARAGLWASAVWLGCRGWRRFERLSRAVEP
jgi:hypothetical protein